MPRKTLSFSLFSAWKFPPLDQQLEKLKSIGYGSVEPFYPLYGDDPVGYRRKIDAVGLTSPTLHAPIDGVIDQIHRFVDIAHTIGAHTIVAPWIDEDKRPTSVEDWKTLAGKLRKSAEVAQVNGLQLAWHNHDFEYVTLDDGSLILDLLVGNGVKLEMDIGWVRRAGRDPIGEMQRYADHLIALHIKDPAHGWETATDDGFAAVGDGLIDWNELWPTVQMLHNVDNVIIERDFPPDWLDFAQRSFATMQKINQ
ncbi:sugar phosphate isomerase/epimerase family protein [Rhizobium sp. LEGMi198b]